MRSRLSILFATVVVGSALGPMVAPASAEVIKIMRLCEGKLCPSFRPAIKVPEGWEEDRQAGEHRGLLVLVPQGQTFQATDVVMYARAQLTGDTAFIDAFVERDHKQWRTRHPGARIERVGQVSRSAGENFHDFRFAAPGMARATSAWPRRLTRTRTGTRISCPSS